MDGTFTLRLIRHAPTAGNRARQYIGWTDEEALPIRARPSLSVREVWGSDLKRCRQTAAALFPEAVYHADPNWRECHFGRFEGKTYEELAQDKAYRQWITDPVRYAPPGGENLLAMEKRVLKAVRSLSDGGAFTVVTHGGPIRLLLSRGTGGGFWEQPALHGHSYTLVWESRRAFEEGKRCISSSAAPLTESGNL